MRCAGVYSGLHCYCAHGRRGSTSLQPAITAPALFMPTCLFEFPGTSIVGDLLPCLFCRSGTGGVGSSSEYPSKSVARCLGKISSGARNLPIAPVLMHKHPRG